MNKPLFLDINAQEHSMSLQSQSNSLEIDAEPEDVLAWRLSFWETCPENTG